MRPRSMPVECASAAPELLTLRVLYLLFLFFFSSTIQLAISVSASMASTVIKFSAILLVIGVCLAQEAKNPQPVTEVCLGCICQAVSGCKLGQQCEGDHCGLFHITWAYWADAGKPTLAGFSPDHPDAYRSCTVDPYCAAQTVQGYMARFGQDCNGDGQVNCYDFMAIHKKGGYGCTGDLPFDYVNVFNQCIATVAAHQG